MAKNVKLLLTETVDSLGIPGDVVNVRIGYARNYLLPRALATTPSDDLIKNLAAKRADAERQLSEQRSQRESATEKLKNYDLELVRSCNDQGVLYGAITQQDVAAALGEKGFSIRPREVRLPGAIKRIDKYDVHVKLDSDLDAIIHLVVKPDREMPKDADEPAAAAGIGGDRRRDAMADLDAADKNRVVGWGGGEKKSADAGSGDGEKKGGKGKKGDAKPEAAKGEAKSEAKAEKAEKPAKGEKAKK